MSSNLFRVILPVFIGIIFLSPITLFAQSEKYPAAMVRTVKRITEADSSEEAKIQHIVSWISRHKRYDAKALIKMDIRRSVSPKRVWRKGRLLCSEYSFLFQYMCQIAHIEAHCVEGYARSMQHYPYERYYYHDHMWNVVKQEGRYHYLDVTWASGYVDCRYRVRDRMRKILGLPYYKTRLVYVKEFNSQYANPVEADFFQSHLPAHPMFQLKSHPFSMRSFEQEKLVSDTFATALDFASRIANYAGKTYPVKLTMVADGAQEFNPRNNWIKATNYTNSAILQWNRIVAAGGDKGSVQVIQDQSTIGQGAASRFLGDNRKIYQDLLDSVLYRKNVCDQFIREKRGYVMAKSQDYSRRIRTNSQLSKRLKFDLRRIRKESARMSSSRTMDFTRRPKMPETDSDAKKQELKWKYTDSLLTLNNDKIRRLHEDYTLTQTQESETMQRLKGAFDSHAPRFSELNSSTLFCIPDFKQYGNVHVQKKDHRGIDSLCTRLENAEKALWKRQVTELLIITKKQDSIVRQALKVLSENKGLLVRIKQQSFEDRGEDGLYDQQNQEVRQWYEALEKKLISEDLVRKGNSGYCKRWSARLKSTSKILKKYGKQVAYRTSFDMGYGKKRMLVYKKFANDLIKSGIRCQQKSGAYLRTLDKK